jgi:hypothetical protein
MQPPTQSELQHLLKHYDPIKAHEYYERTKKLKGRKNVNAGMGKSRARRHTHPKTNAGPTRSQKVWIRRQEAAQKILLDKQKAIQQATLEKQKAAEKARIEKQQAARLKQRKVVTAQVQDLEGKLKKLEDLIAAKLREEASQERKVLFSARVATQEAAKPPTAAEKSQAARASAQYRDQNQQKVKTAAKASAPAKSAQLPSSYSTPASAGSGKQFSVPSGSSLPKAATSKNAQDVAKLKTLATKVKGQLAVAKQKLAAL